MKFLGVTICMIKERDYYFDFIKGIGIFFVLWGHCIQYGMVKAGDFFENPLFKVIYSFHMPLLMLISGYLFFYSSRRRTLKHLLVSKLKSLGYPLLLWGCIHPVLSALKMIFSDDTSIEIKDVAIIFIRNCINGVTGIWFLWAVLLISIIMAFAERTYSGGAKGKVVYIVILLTGATLLCMLPGKQNNLFMYPYFIIGCCSHRFMSSNKKCFQQIELISIVLYILLLFFTTETAIYIHRVYGFLIDTNLGVKYGLTCTGMRLACLAQ